MRTFNHKEDVKNEINYIYNDLQTLLSNPLLNNLDMRIIFILYELSILFSSRKILNDFELILGTSSKNHIQNCKGLCDYIKKFKSYKEDLANIIKT